MSYLSDATVYTRLNALDGREL